LVSYSGIAKHVEFGIAKVTNQRTSFGDSEIEGKFGYMAPEQVLGAVVDRRTDLFAVGVMLYTLTTGRHPFEGADSSEMLRNIVSDEPPIRPSLLKANYSRTLEAVVLKALEKGREGRWLSAEEMRLALQRGVPQAFELGFEAQLRTFMADTVGDRAVRKREALRRAELAVDAYAAQLQSSATAISATSLRAISLDTSAQVTDSLRPIAPRVSRFPTLRPDVTGLAPRRRAYRSLAIGAAAIAALVFGLVWRRPTNDAPQAASSPATGMVDLTPPRAPNVAVPPVVSASASAAGSARPLPKAPH
jgi:hypothetical protein